MTEPGQPCVMISGNALSCRDLTWMKWISTPSISVVNCGSALSRASHVRQSYSVVQYRASSRSVASCTPCDRSSTSSLLGQRVAPMRRRRSSRSSSGTSTRKGLTAGWVSIGCTPPVERLGVISPAVLHNEVKCEVLEGLAQLPRTPLRRSSQKAPFRYLVNKDRERPRPHSPGLDEVSAVNKRRQAELGSFYP